MHNSPDQTQLFGTLLEWRNARRAPKTQVGNGRKGKAGTSAPAIWPDAWQAFDIVGLAAPYGIASTPADPAHPIYTLAPGSFTNAIAAGRASLRLDLENFDTLDVSQANGRLMLSEEAASCSGSGYQRIKQRSCCKDRSRADPFDTAASNSKVRRSNAAVVTNSFIESALLRCHGS